MRRPPGPQHFSCAKPVASLRWPGWVQVLSLALKPVESNHIGLLAGLRHYGGFQWHGASLILEVLGLHNGQRSLFDSTLSIANSAGVDPEGRGYG